MRTVKRFVDISIRNTEYATPYTTRTSFFPNSPCGRTIINTVLLTILDVIDFGMNAQEAVDAGRIHHQWLPDRLTYEEYGFSDDTIEKLKAMGHTVQQGGNQGVAQVIVYNQKDDMLEGGLDRRAPDGGAAGK